MKTTNIFFQLLAICLCATPNRRAGGDTFGSAANTFNVEFVSIGNPGNAADTTGKPNPAGSVGYSYRISKYEISEGMIDKANAQSAADGSPLEITHFNLGPTKPATFVGWFEAAKFVNWLNTNSGNSPAYKFDDNGVFQMWTSNDAGFNPSNVFRNRLARYVLPDVNEWYKAAYYDPIRKTYYDYPTGSNSLPDGIDFRGDPAFDAVFYDRDSNQFPNDITNVGVLSPYGTAGQGGNVEEWEETDFDLDNGLPANFRGVRGGAYRFSVGLLSASSRTGFGNPASDGDWLGFRVASVPEPNTCTLVVFLLSAQMLTVVRRAARLTYGRNGGGSLTSACARIGG